MYAVLWIMKRFIIHHKSIKSGLFKITTVTGLPSQVTGAGYECSYLTSMVIVMITSPGGRSAASIGFRGVKLSATSIPSIT